MKNQVETIGSLLLVLLCFMCLGFLHNDNRQLRSRVENLEQAMRQQDEQQLAERLRMLESRSAP